jgi:Fe-S-cluster containining protein
MKMNEISQKLSKKEESDLCLECGECCKRYYITLLPNEAVKIAKELKITKKKFLEEYCELNVKIYPKTTQGVLTFPSVFFPQNIITQIKKKNFSIADSFFIVPQVVLKREEAVTQTFFNNQAKREKRNACIFIDAKNMCKIYSSRPAPCKLFPFIAMPDLREQYPFCKLYQNTSKNLSIESKNYYSQVQDYFKEVDKKTLFGLWHTPPREGTLFFSDSLVGRITIEELTEMMPKKE